MYEKIQALKMADIGGYLLIYTNRFGLIQRLRPFSGDWNDLCDTLKEEGFTFLENEIHVHTQLRLNPVGSCTIRCATGVYRVKADSYGIWEKKIEDRR
jgi:hypothetical protein